MVGSRPEEEPDPENENLMAILNKEDDAQGRVCIERGYHFVAFERSCEPMNCYECGLEFYKGNSVKYVIERIRT